MEFPIVYVIVDVDSEYGHRNLVAVYLSIESARAALTHLHKSTSSHKWVEIARDVFGVAGGLQFESLEIVEMPVIDSAAMALSWLDRLSVVMKD